MKKVLEIVAQDLRVFLSDRSNLPGLLFTPVLMTVLIGFVSGGALASGDLTLLVDVIDHDQSAESSQLLQAVVESDPSLVLCSQSDAADDRCDLNGASMLDLETGLRRVAEGTTIGLIEIPAGLGDSVQNQSPAMVQLYIVTDFGEGQTAEQALASALGQMNGAAAAASAGLVGLQRLAPDLLSHSASDSVEAELYQTALEIWKQQPVRVRLALSGEDDQGGVIGSLQQGLGQSVPGMGTMFAMLTVFGGMAALIEERRQWTLQRLAAMPIGRARLLLGKVLARFSLGLLQMLVIFIVGALLGMNFGRDPVALVVVTVAYVLAITAISFAIGSRLSNSGQASSMSLLLTLLLAPLGGAWWPLDVAPTFMQMAGRVSPISWAMSAFNHLTYEQGVLAEVLPQAAVLLGMAAIAFLLGLTRFKYQLDQLSS